jgi:ribosomal protein L25 (general stress protein Ctc)
LGEEGQPEAGGQGRVEIIIYPGGADNSAIELNNK